LEPLSADDPEFITEITALDRMRFSAPPSESSPELGQPQTAQFTKRLIFCADPVPALTLFVLACWYDAQTMYAQTWSRGLEKLADWMATPDNSECTLPRTRAGPWSWRSAWKTWSRWRDGGFGAYFAETVTAIAANNPNGKGNTWKFVSRLALDLTCPSPENQSAFEALQAGYYRPIPYKRVWMLAMLLRRDQGIIRCLLERALSVVGGADVACAWYDERLFPSNECELPVDGRILTIGEKLFPTISRSENALISKAHEWGQRHRLSPSTLDALFFAMD
jgi:hypothetical protein